MRHTDQVTGLLAFLVLANVGCGSRAKPDVDQPAAVPSEAPHTPAGPSGQVSQTQDPLDGSSRATLEERIGFAFDRSDLSTQARSILSAKAEVLKRSPDITLRVEGHADERGSDEYNLALSNRRAAAAKRFLMERGIGPERVETVGFGEERPLDPGQSESAWAANRRAEFLVTGGGVAQR
jgi:peptidoglycan-associated lipoprotein